MRHWIIGNGYSLNSTPLDLLKNEITWGMNAVHLIPFRPTYYYCIDVNENQKSWQEMVQANLHSKKVFLREEWRGMFRGANIEWIKICERHHWYAADNYRKRAESWHLPEICTAFGSMHTVLQLAVLHGATEIYLVGCDLFDGKQDHFSENYPAFVDQKERNLIEVHIHQVARRSSPVPIYNATIGGYLEVHPRVHIMDVLNAKEEEVYRTGA